MFKIYAFQFILMLLSGTSYTSPVPEETTTDLHDLQIIQECVAEEWADCKILLEKRLSTDSVEFMQLHSLDDFPLEAAHKGYTELIQALLNSGVKVNNTYGEHKKNLLHEAAEWAPNNGLVTFLLERGAHINVKDKHGDSPLHRAVSSNNKDTVNLLIDKGADLKARNVRGETPLHSAVIHNCTKCLELLVKSGADINIGDNRGRTPLHEAVAYDNVFAVKYLMSKGCNTRKKANINMDVTALDIALLKQITEIVNILESDYYTF